jgi:hypothetical protein
MDGNADEFHAALRTHLPVLYLHGTLESGYRLSESDTYNLDTPLARLMVADMVLNWFVWIGYSLTDADLRTLYLSTRDLLAREGLVKKPFVIHPLNPNESDSTKRDEAKNKEWKLADAVWKARGVRFIPGRAEVFLPALVERVRRGWGDELAVKIIKKRLHITDNTPIPSAEVDKLWQSATKTSNGIGDDIDGIEIIAESEGVL